VDPFSIDELEQIFEENPDCPKELGRRSRREILETVFVYIAVSALGLAAFGASVVAIMTFLGAAHK
jgi:hypothetical protein